MDNAYSQLALCGPSRTSLLTSRLPERMQILSNSNLNWRENAKIKNVYSLPQYYKEHGYHTKSIGKIFHPIGKVIDTKYYIQQIWSRILFWKQKVGRTNLIYSRNGLRKVSFGLMGASLYWWGLRPFKLQGLGYTRTVHNQISTLTLSDSS